MGDGITQHALGPDDLALLLAVEDGLFDHPIRPDQAAAFLTEPNNFLILAYDGDYAVGMVSATVLLHPDRLPALFINELGVRENWRRQGIATGLMGSMIELGRTCGCHGVWLGTEADNTPALALYRKIAEEEQPGSFFGWDGALSWD